MESVDDQNISADKSSDSMELSDDKCTENNQSKTVTGFSVGFKTPDLPSFNKVKRTNDKNVSQTENALKKEDIKPESQTDKGDNENTCSEPQKISDTKESVSKPVSKLSPAEQLQQSRIAIPYKEPSWGGVCEEDYKFEVLKNGTIIDTIKLDKSFFVFGRLPSCDVPMEHPSLSRHHAVVQFCRIQTNDQEKGWYLYDLDSTHGTWINKNKVYPKKYYRIRVGHVLKFGGSTRLHILQGPEEDREEESNLSLEEMKQQREKQKREAEFLRQAELAEEERKIQELKAKEEARGCSWGMGDDAQEEEGENPFANLINNPENEKLYIDDPKKALKGYFEREGYDEPEYNVQENGAGKFKCLIELPVDTPTGEPMVAEAIVSGKKKEAVVQCALEACRVLDRMGLLRAATHESRKRKKKNWEDDDYYDSDEDTFLDRTGDIEKKRKQRMEKAGKINNKVETYDSLIEKLNNLQKEIKDIEDNLAQAKKETEAMQEDGMDALDAYMSAIKSGAMDTKTKMKLKRQLLELRKEEQKLQRMVNVAKPAALPDIKSSVIKDKISKTQFAFGRQKNPVPTMKPKAPPSPRPSESEGNREEVEEEEEGEETPMKTSETSASSSLSVTEERTGSETRGATNEIKNSVPLSPVVLKSESENIQETSKLDRNAPVVKGPSFPPLELRGSNSPEDGNPSERKKAEKQKKKNMPPKVRKPEVKLGPNYQTEDPDYAVWVPPDNQSGDGKTHLNQKFGY
ncbi:kanadaptin-like [Crassostrea virginica]|uniref:Kanadaptin-like n=1 Tax=Crassostrea virginica TaxID=6565 RepID=A0A8B8E4H9_CRAVI|nr:kanadaptin-like [Crassostrea virginica]